MRNAGIQKTVSPIIDWIESDIHFWNSARTFSCFSCAAAVACLSRIRLPSAFFLHTVTLRLFSVASIFLLLT